MSFVQGNQRYCIKHFDPDSKCFRHKEPRDIYLDHTTIEAEITPNNTSAFCHRCTKNFKPGELRWAFHIRSIPHKTTHRFHVDAFEFTFPRWPRTRRETGYFWVEIKTSNKTLFNMTPQHERRFKEILYDFRHKKALLRLPKTIDSMNKAELVDELSIRLVATGGTKEEKQKRLRNYLHYPWIIKNQRRDNLTVTQFWIKEETNKEIPKILEVLISQFLPYGKFTW